jgi:hypothetical protein
MSLTEKQIEEYREKLRDREYMGTAITGIAKIVSTGYAMAKQPDAEPEINNTEGEEMAKNNVQDLCDHLFERIEWLADRDVTGAELTEEIKRTEAIVKVSVQLVNIANAVTKAKTVAGNSNGKIKLPAMLEDKPK